VTIEKERAGDFPSEVEVISLFRRKEKESLSNRMRSEIVRLSQCRR